MVEFVGYDAIVTKLSKLYDADGVAKGMDKSCALVERDAKTKAQKDTGALRRSIKSKVKTEDMVIVGTISSPLEYAPYVEYGTGLFAENGGRKTAWSYTDEKTGETIWTHGQHPQPYMRPALNENKEEIISLIKEGLLDD